MPTVTAERLLIDLSTQLDTFLFFLHLDLSSVISETGAEQWVGQRAVSLIAGGENSSRWIEAFRVIHRWTELALREQEWLHETGRSQPMPCSGSHRLGTMSLFIQQQGLPKNPNTTKSLQHGRKLMRFEHEFGPGITLLLIPVLPAFRQLSMAEEAKAIDMLRNGDFANIKQNAQSLTRLRYQYQHIYGISAGDLSCSIGLNVPANTLF
jgi:hypothetical protein